MSRLVAFLTPPNLTEIPAGTPSTEADRIAYNNVLARLLYCGRVFLPLAVIIIGVMYLLNIFPAKPPPM